MRELTVFYGYNSFADLTLLSTVNSWDIFGSALRKPVAKQNIFNLFTPAFSDLFSDGKFAYLTLIKNNKHAQIRFDILSFRFSRRTTLIYNLANERAKWQGSWLLFPLRSAEKLEVGNATHKPEIIINNKHPLGEFEMSMNCHDNVFIIYERASRCVGVANKRILLMNTRHHVRPRNVRVPIVRKAGKARQVKPLSLPLHTVLIFPPFPNFPHNPF